MLCTLSDRYTRASEILREREPETQDPQARSVGQQQVRDQEREEVPEHQRQGTSAVEEAPKWVEEQYRNSEPAPDAAWYDRYTLPHRFGRQQ
jgi:hypothetical protein